MQRFAWSAFAAAIVVAVALILATTGSLPESVASHFARGGRADGFMPRELYVALMAGLAAGVPLLVAAATTWLPRVAPGLLKLDRCKRWADPAARPKILAMTATFGAVVGTIVAVFLACLHLIVVDANGQAPPHLDSTGLVTLAGTFAVTMIVVVVLHSHRTRRA